jgi:metallophosphoesterase superfamily enzyme
MQRFSTQSNLNLAHMTWEHIFEAFYISFSDSHLVHEMSLRQKGTYAPPQDKARGLNIHDGKRAFGPI